MAARLWYVTTNGNDSTGDGTIGNPFATPLPACFGGAFQASSGDTITIGAGTFTMGVNGIFVPAGVEMLGAGMAVTVIRSGTSTAVYHSNPVCVINPGSGSNVHDLTIDCSAGTPSGIGKAFGYSRTIDNNPAFD